DNIIVVDDGSKDRTKEIAKKAGAKVIRYGKNKGVDYASRIGLEGVIKMKSDIILFIDADGQLDPKYIPEFIKAIENGAEYVSGWRDLSNYPLDRKIGNWGLTKLTNIFCPTGLHDTECGFRAMSIETAKKIKLIGNRYEREMDFAYEIWRNKLKVKEIKIKVPVFYSKSAIKRGFNNFLFLLKRRFYFI
ncbi:MAG: glycosyltransferase family 2 protein, partial [Spirochaetota bacterium]|nr:glycosyltransferase family 2 protein [Spirochaetota bacterium]